MIVRTIALFVGLALVPACVAATQTFYGLLRAVQPESLTAIPPAAWALIGGFLLWVFLYATLPRPMRSYVLAHELTHALWAWLMGARVQGLNVSEDRGSVVLSKSNVWITLAPYFFPLYTVLVIVGYYLLSVFYDIEGYFPFWLGAVGFTWGFHFTFTISTLMQHQTDIQEYGKIFSYSLIYLLNILGICLWIVIVSSATLEELADGFADNLTTQITWIRDGVAFLIEETGQ